MQYLSLFLLIIVSLIFVKPIGTFLYHVLNGEKTFAEKMFSPIENFIYKLCGIEPDGEMTWRRYAIALIVTNLVMIVVCFIVLRIQQYLPLNPTKASNMNPYLAINTVISFMTNTNLQHYAGESSITFLSQMIVVIFLMFSSAASGICAVTALVRGITSKRETLGNFYKDFTRIIVRVLLPISFVFTIIFVSQGVPQTFNAKTTFDTISGGKQTIITGPVAVLESIKHIGTNGGGFFSANSAHPFENPTPVTNFLEMFSMMLIPTSLLYAFGLMANSKKHARILYGALILMFILFGIGAISSEVNPGKFYKSFNVSSNYGNMEGKEMRFGAKDSALFSTVTTAYTTGSVNSSLDSYTPLGGAVPMTLMMLNTVFGGDGAGLMNIIMYAILTVFITGLMVGRTPEYLGKKIETNEVKLVAIAILVHPLLILFASAISLKTNVGLSAITNPGYHGLSQMIYEFTSASANNGSEFAGFIGNTTFMNCLTGLIMFLGRYIPLILLLAVGGSMAQKRILEPSPGTFRTDNGLFGVLFIVTIIIVGALTFFPALVLGPVAEFLSI